MSLSDKHVFFDLDRTLWDFDSNSKNALLQIFEELDLIEIFKTFDRFYNAYVAQNARLWTLYVNGQLAKEVLRYERFNATLKQFKIDNIEMAKKMGSMYVSISPFQKKLFPGTIACLEELRSIGFKLHIITNGFEEVQYIKLENCGLDGFFDVIVCSEAVGQNKPARAIFQYALKEAGCTAENAIMIGDDFRADISGALNSGMKAIHFDPHSLSKENYPFTCQSLSDLPLMVTQLLLSSN
jgi:putative hydrolase of the HAD superfamily